MTARRRGPGADQAGLADAERNERVLLDVIKSRTDQGISARDLKSEAKLPVDDKIFATYLKSLLTTKKLIKEVVNCQYKGRKTYMAVEFQPSKDVCGGDWYVDGNLDVELIAHVRRMCLRLIRSRTVATVEGVHNEVKKIVTFDISVFQVKEILNAMILDDEVLEVKSTGLKEYRPIPVGTVCYRIPVSGLGASKGVKLGALASIPCRVCPRISECTPDGVISPSTCVYYTKWLDF